MAIFTIFVEPQVTSHLDSFKWCLDMPINGIEQSGQEIQDHGIRLKGWLLTRPEANAQLAVLDGSKALTIPLNSLREDVIDKVAKKSTVFETNKKCGFDHIIKPATDCLYLGIIYKSKFNPIYKLTIKGHFQILEGKDSWLFLDNDTNKSVEQFTGKIKLRRVERKRWIEYIGKFSELTISKNSHSAFLVAPSKEYVLDQFYPYKRGRKTPLDEVLKLADDACNLVFPRDALANHSQRTYRIADTHWNSHGAMVASLEVIKKLDIDYSPVAHLFKKDSYTLRKVPGDLGSKTYPPREFEEYILKTFRYKKSIVYDNNLPNFGRAIIMENAGALYEKSLVIFGSSSAYSMFNYLVRTFNVVVFFHTAGNVDKEILDKISPDYLLAQTNARFIVRSPSFDIKLASYIKAKINQLTTVPDVTLKENDLSSFSSKVIQMLGE